jgi:hypothetical protein
LIPLLWFSFCLEKNTIVAEGLKWKNLPLATRIILRKMLENVHVILQWKR